ncbi:MAG: hypothetical protein N3E51_01820 [Candidatus Micrarchaeota archaeon]|nr:hypothetical protein [Candidatus Micrarchaeota archaeon]
MGLFGETEAQKASAISILYTLSFASLFAIGTLLMAFANFLLGVILFSLGLLLMVANEYMLLRRQPPAAFSSPSEALSSLLSFAVASYLFPATIALFLYFGYGFSERVLVVVAAGFIITSVKIAAKTAEFYAGR